MLIEIRHKGLETFQIYNLSMVVVKKIPTIERQTYRKGTRKVCDPETPKKSRKSICVTEWPEYVWYSKELSTCTKAETEGHMMIPTRTHCGLPW
jgi:hypothetical protein